MDFISHLLEHPSLFAYFSGANNYTWLQFRNGDRRLLAKPLLYFEKRLPTFIRIHKTALINPASVAGVQHPLRAKMPGLVRMQDGTELPVSRRRWDEVSELLQAGLDKAAAEVASSDALAPAQPEPNVGTPYVSPPLVVLAVMAGDALLLTRDCIDGIGLHCLLQHVESGGALATSLLLNPEQPRPSLIILDARTKRADRMVTLRSLKSHDQLRSIPVVWLASPGEDTMLAYVMNANSVVVVPDKPASFVSIIEQLCRYWLMMVQLPPEGIAR